MNEIKERPLIQVKTINRKIFEQIPERNVVGSGDEFLGCVNRAHFLYRRKDGNLYQVHFLNFSDPFARQGKFIDAQEFKSKAPQIFLV